MTRAEPAWLSAVREAVRAELGDGVRCRTCGAWFARPAGLEPWVAAQACEGAACQREAADYAAKLAKRRAA